MTERYRTLKTAYQQYGEPSGQKSGQQRTPGCRKPSHRSGWCHGRTSDERECHLLGQSLAGLSALTLSGNTMRHHVWPPHKRGRAALGLKAAETLVIRPRRFAGPVPYCSQTTGARAANAVEMFKETKKEEQTNEGKNQAGCS